jgi:Glycosyltransferases, probably involved in cell wall biogenesis
MSPNKEIFPEVKLDRRIFPNIPREGQTRRAPGERFLCDFYVDVFRTYDETDPLFESLTKDLSYSGILLDLPAGEDGIKAGDVLFLRFSIPQGTLPEGYEHRVAIQATVARVDKDEKTFALQFAENLKTFLSRRRWRYFEYAGLLLIALTILGISLIRMDSVFYFLFDVPVFFYGICTSLFLVSRFFFALFYRNVPIDPDYTPSVTIVIPCFNEEKFITRTIRCALDQDYPEDKLKVIVVDDGSTDRSVERVLEFQEQTRHLLKGDRLKVIVHKQNAGKRHVMATGTLDADTELMIFVDSDSFLESIAVRQLVQPLQDKRIGAVCGRCEVENKWTNYITKMQAVRYFIAFQIFKGAESVFDAVTCLSGPLSCYRRELILKYLDPWLNQKFFGLPATFGDDRSLTNFILPNHRVVYQHDSVCTTIVPSTFKQFCTQQMRWKRSWLRESLRAGKFMWRTEPFMALSFYAGLALPVLAPFIVLRSFVYIPLMYGYLPITFILGILLMSMLMSSTYLILKRSNLWFYGGFFCLFYLGILLWQMMPAMFTFWKAEWGTRETAADVEAKKKRKAAQLKVEKVA